MWLSCGRWRHLCRFGGLLHTSPRIGPKSREECELATGQTRSGRCNRLQLANRVTRRGRDHRMHVAKLRCITLTTPANALWGPRKSQRDTPGRHCLWHSAIHAARETGGAPTADAITRTTAQPRQSRFRREKHRPAHRLGGLPPAPHDATRRKRAAHPAGYGSVWPWATPCISATGVMTRFPAF